MSTQSNPPFETLVDVHPSLLTFSIDHTFHHLVLYNNHSHPVHFSVRVSQNVKDKYFISQKKGVVFPRSRNSISIFHKDTTSLNTTLDAIVVCFKQSKAEDGQRPSKCFKTVYARLKNDDHTPTLPHEAFHSMLTTPGYVHPETRLMSQSRDSTQGRIHTSNTPQGSIRTGDAHNGSIRINGARQGSIHTGDAHNGSIRINGARQGSSNTSSTSQGSSRTSSTSQGSSRTSSTSQGSSRTGNTPQRTIHTNGTSEERGHIGGLPPGQQKVSSCAASGWEFLAQLVGFLSGLYLLMMATNSKGSSSPAPAIARTLTAMFTGIMAQLLWQWFCRGMADPQGRVGRVHWEADPQVSPVDKTQPAVGSASLHVLGLMGTVSILYVTYGHPAWCGVMMENIRSIIAGIAGMLFMSVCRRLWQETAGRHRQYRG